MAIVDIISWELNEQELIHRFESDELRLGSQLVVYPGQTAFFVKGGELFDQFEKGTYTIKSENIPLLGKVVNLPFNGETPFKAEVWFVNRLSLLNNKWGTMTPIQVEDPRYEIIVPIRAYGQYGIRIEEPRLFLDKLVGNMSSFATDKVVEYFKGVLLSKLTKIVYDALREQNQSVLTISSQIEMLSSYAEERLRTDFAKYGVGIEMFHIISISIKEDDPSYVRLKEAKDTKARINVIGRDDYQMSRSIDVLEKAADNQSGMAGAAMGVGAGLGLGSVAASMASKTINIDLQATTPPPLPTKSYHIAVNGQQIGSFSMTEIEEKYRKGEIDNYTLVWAPGMKQWESLGEHVDFAHLTGNTPPPLP